MVRDIAEITYQGRQPLLRHRSVMIRSAHFHQLHEYGGSVIISAGGTLFLVEVANPVNEWTGAGSETYYSIVVTIAITLKTP